MNADLFSTFDYGFGVSIMSSGVVLWVSSSFFLFFVMNVLGYWHSFSRSSGGYSSFGSSLSENLRPFQVSSLGSGVLFVISLVTVLLSMNMFGMGPYVFGVTCHFAFTMSISFSVWLSMFLYNSFSNFSIFVGSFVLPDLPLVGSMLMVWIEMLSNLIRALTLSLRLCLNLASGQIIMGLLGSFSNVMFVAGVGSAGIFCSLGCGVLLVMDLFIAGLQAVLFVALVVMYMDELVYC